MSALKQSETQTGGSDGGTSSEEESHPPPYEANVSHEQVPRYQGRSHVNAEIQASSDAKSKSVRAGAHDNQQSRTTRRHSTPQLLNDKGKVKRIPPEHLCKTPARLPAASSHSPFDDMRAQASSRQPASRRSSMPGPDRHRSHLVAGFRHGDYDVHRLHGLSDSRMHALPEVDEHGNPKRDIKAGSMMVGAAVGVLAVAACNIM